VSLDFYSSMSQKIPHFATGIKWLPTASSRGQARHLYAAHKLYYGKGLAEVATIVVQYRC
jgi:hypothetical protein